MTAILVDVNLFEVLIPGEVFIPFHVIQDIHRLAIVSVPMMENAP